MSKERLWARFSPAFRLCMLAIVLMGCALVSPARIVGVLVFTAVVVGLLLVSKTPIRLVALRLVPLAWFIAGVACLLLITPRSEDERAVRLPVFERSVSAQGLSFLVALSVKSVLLVVVANASVRLVSERDVLAGLLGLRIPGRVGAVLYLMIRSLRDVRDEALRLVRARDARGKPKGLRAVAVAGSLSRVLLLRLGQRADLRAAALVSRGFKGRLVMMGHSGLSRVEAGLLLVCGLGVAVIARL